MKRERETKVQDWLENECRIANESKNKAHRNMINRKFIRNLIVEYKQAQRVGKRLHKNKNKCHNLLEEVERLKSSNKSKAFYLAVNTERKDL